MKGKEVSPLLAGIIIVIVIAAVGALIWRHTGAGGRTGMTPEMKAKMQQMFGNKAPAAPPMAGKTPNGMPMSR